MNILAALVEFYLAWVCFNLAFYRWYKYSSPAIIIIGFVALYFGSYLLAIK